MIALRGQLERIRDAEKPADGVSAPSQPGVAPPSTNTNSTKWKFTGQWAFGKHISEADVASSKAASASALGAVGLSGAAGPAKQLFGFSYTWESAMNPLDVRVPSEEIRHREEQLDKEEAERDAELLAKSEVNVVAPSTEKSNPESQSAETGTESSATNDDPKTDSASAEKNATPSSSQESSKQSTDPSTAVKSSETTTTPATAQSKSNQSTPAPDIATFADDFTDAATKNPDKVPIGGRWKGSFDTAATPANPRKALPATIIPIDETFVLFLNENPPPNARTQFADEQESILTNAETRLEPGHIHARGMGENQYGIFELIGSLHLETGIVHLQKLYVQTPETASRNKRNSPRGRRRSVRLPTEATGGGEASRGTRKRSLTWKKRSMMEGGEVDPASVSTTPKGSNKKQRKRGASVGGIPVDESGLTGSGALPANPDVQASGGSTMGVTLQTTASAPGDSTASGGGGSRKWPGLPLSIPGKAEARRTSSASSRKRSASVGSVRTPVSASPRGVAMKLPLAGDPMKARWRAAHFMYYYKPPANSNDDTASTASGGEKSASAASQQAAATKSVVYEGEMLNGQRHGRGICLYDNGLIYEGTWLFDKESGYGTLLSGDRKRIIYEGEFERGRISGRGVYYYGDDPKPSDGKKKKASPTSAAKSGPTRSNCRYEGEWRENMRHGQGIYVLPDNSVFDGSWTNGTMNGRGVFRVSTSCSRIIVCYSLIMVCVANPHMSSSEMNSGQTAVSTMAIGKMVNAMGKVSYGHPMASRMRVVG